MHRILQYFVKNELSQCGDICYSYNSCNSVPCNCDIPKQITKNHDFHQDIKYNKEYKYIVIFRRDIISNILAYLRMLKACKLYNNGNSDIELTKDDLLANGNINHCIDLMKKFQNKWMNLENCLHIYSEDFIDDPYFVMEQLYNFFKHDNNINYYVDIIKNECKFKKVDKNGKLYLMVNKIYNQ